MGKPKEVGHAECGQGAKSKIVGQAKSKKVDHAFSKLDHAESEDDHCQKLNPRNRITLI